MKISFLALAALLFSALFQPAQAQKRVAAPRALAVTVIVSPDDAFVQNWNSPQAPQITRLRSVVVDQKVTVAVLLSGLRAVKGQIRYRVAAQILDPNGKVIFDAPNFAAATQKAPAANAFLLVNPSFDFSAEDSDPRGIYRFRAVVTDLNAAKNSLKTAAGEWKVELKNPE